MNSKQLSIILGAIALVAILAAVYFAYGNRDQIPDTNQNNNTSVNANSNTNKPSNTNQANDPTASWKTYSNNTVGISFKYPNNFQVTYNPEKDHRVLISDRPISFPEIGGNDALISVGKILSPQDVTSIVDSMQNKRETRITVDGLSARRIEGYSSPYPPEKIFTVLVVIDSKNIVAISSEKRSFDPLSVFDQIVSSLKFTK